MLPGSKTAKTMQQALQRFICVGCEENMWIIRWAAPLFHRPQGICKWIQSTTACRAQVYPPSGPSIWDVFNAFLKMFKIRWGGRLETDIQYCRKAQKQQLWHKNNEGSADFSLIVLNLTINIWLMSNYYSFFQEQHYSCSDADMMHSKISFKMLK